MKKLILLFATLFFVGCSSTNETDKKTTFTPTPTGLSGIKQSGAKNKTLSDNQAKTNLITNPKHGEPGHRCDIAVGAPLNTNVQKQIQPQPLQAETQANQVIQVKQPNKTASTTRQMLNPKHGEPGHRCDLAVGAPLNSTENKKQAVNVNQNITLTPKNTQQTTTDSQNQKLNPPHGQPGHKCELAVGAPLN